MSEGKTNTIRQIVSPVGNAWIVANSKSHSGHVYYFNTLTGEAVWNLSDAEIENARLRTQILEQQHGVKPTKCPEPSGNPPQLQREFTKQFKNQYRVGNHQQTNICQQPGINIFQTQQSSGPMYSDMSVNNISPIDLNALNQLNAYNFVTNSTLYNSHSSFIPRTQQFFITPTIPVVNQAQASLNIAYSQLREHDQAPAGGFNSFQNRRSRWNRVYRNNNNFKKGGKRNNCQPINKDLRERITLRRRLSSNSHQEQNLYTNTDSENKNIHSSRVNSRATSVSSLITDEDAFEEDIRDQNTTEEHSFDEDYRNSEKSNVVNISGDNNETSSKLDLTPLKSPEHFDGQLDVWHIVIDLNILLSEFTLLHMMLESDEHCRLVVPDNVMTELKKFIASSNNIPARRIFYSLLQLIKDGYVCVDENASQDDGNTITNPVLNTCFELLQKDQHVILITNDSELLKYKKFISISIFSMDDVKSLLGVDLAQNQAKDSSDSNSQLYSKRVFQDISLLKAGVRRKSATVTEESSNVHESQKVRQDSAKISELASTVDAAIQTDKVTVISNSRNKDINVCLSPKENEKHSQTNETIQISNKDTSQNFKVTTTPVKRREIKLKRSTSHQPPTAKCLANNKVKQPFRWRRRQPVNCKDNTQLPNNNEPQLNSAVDFVPSNICKPTQQNVITRHDNTKEHIKDSNKEKDSATISVERHLDSNDLRQLNSETNEQNSNSNKKPNSANPKVTSVHTNLDTNELNMEVQRELISNNEKESSNLEDAIESRESSVVCINTRKENICIDLSSASGITINSGNNIESVFKESKTCHDGSSQDDVINAIVMYEVENASMEESLKTNCEEWVSRFIQIMEDVLSVILHKETMLSKTELPPPWTLHEAAQCIRKYNNNIAVKFTTDKLSCLLFELSDSAGKINTKITPHQYMMMYSYGVSLLRAIKDSVTDTEDIQIAENSLQKLLNDIKNPYCSTDSEMDPQDVSFNISVDGLILDALNDENDGIQENLSNLPIQAKENCNLMSATNNSKNMLDVPSSPVQENKEKVNRYANWNLKNITRQIVNTIESNESSKENLNDNLNDLHSPVTFSSDINRHIASEKPLNEPKIVRKFVTCSQFEENLKNTSIDYEHLDYIEEYCSYTTSDEGQLVIDTDLNHDSSKICNDAVSPRNLIMDTSKTTNSRTHSNIMFKILMKMFLQEIRNTLNNVKILCDSCYMELENPQQVLKEKHDLHKRAEYAQSHVDSLCTELKSMWDRDKNTPSGDIQNALDKAGINLLHIDEHLLKDYGNTIELCKNQAEVFLYSLQEIITDIKST